MFCSGRTTCVDVTCENGAKCKDTIGNFICECGELYTGIYCETGSYYMNYSLLLPTLYQTQDADQMYYGSGNFACLNFR